MKNNIGKNIKNFRVANNMTQYDLSTALCVSPITISRYETGQREPSLDMLKKISDVLNIPVSSFFLSDADFKKIGDAMEVDLNEAGFGDFVKKVLDSKDNKILNDFNLLNELGKAEALKRVSELTLLSKYTDEKEFTKDDALKSELSDMLKYF
ncbi:helix-turn-helix domain-containing protein [Senimuribacter intestinalis]|uniref:helix-turn-helix domain-containing protein n=1 Tax=Senimuribacter intestinalis TaxID=2941507 RepID=UPI00204202BB|nr:helix-turn-helix domain-containing protein [Senimuribacter intestinalis]